MQRILVIEDDRALACSILDGLDLLQMPDLEKEAQYDGLGGLTRLQFGPMPDVLVLDMRLPNLGGQQIYDEIRQKAPDCQVIVLTEDVWQASEIRSQAADWERRVPPQAVFLKPFLPGRLLNAVRKCLGLPEESLT